MSEIPSFAAYYMLVFINYWSFSMLLNVVFYWLIEFPLKENFKYFIHCLCSDITISWAWQSFKRRNIGDGFRGGGGGALLPNGEIIEMQIFK